MLSMLSTQVHTLHFSLPLRPLGMSGTWLSSKSFSYVSTVYHSVGGPEPFTLRAQRRTWYTDRRSSPSSVYRRLSPAVVTVSPRRSPRLSRFLYLSLYPVMIPLRPSLGGASHLTVTLCRQRNTMCTSLTCNCSREKVEMYEIKRTLNLQCTPHVCYIWLFSLLLQEFKSCLLSIVSMLACWQQRKMATGHLITWSKKKWTKKIPDIIIYRTATLLKEQFSGKSWPRDCCLSWGL